MSEFGVKYGMVGLDIGVDFLGDRFQSFQMRIWIAISESVICDQAEAFVQKGLELGVHGLFVFCTAEAQRLRWDSEDNLSFGVQSSIRKLNCVMQELRVGRLAVLEGCRFLHANIIVVRHSNASCLQHDFIGHCGGGES